MLASNKEFWDQAIHWYQSNFKRTETVAIVTKFERQLVIIGWYTTYLGDHCVKHGIFLVGLLNDVTKILPRLTLVAMATKFETKQAVTHW